jgi:hypothetical protein
MFFMASTSVIFDYVRHAPQQSLLANWPWLLVLLGTFVPLLVSVYLLGRLGALEEKYPTPTAEMRRLFTWATIGVGGYSVALVVMQFVLLR